ncbi:MAG: hypothetical protein F4X46_06435 [Chloroflexi bacterium]|nr:hypothetical protein [Chloroflexota bacterium]
MPQQAREGEKGSDTFAAAQVDTLEFSNLRDYVSSRRYAVDRSLLDDGGWSLAQGEIQNILRKISKNTTPLSEVVHSRIYRGVTTGRNEAFIIDEKTREKLISQDLSSAEIIKPLLRGRDIKRFTPPRNLGYT